MACQVLLKPVSMADRFDYNQVMNNLIIKTPDSRISLLNFSLFQLPVRVVVGLLFVLFLCSLTVSNGWAEEAELKGTQPAHFRVVWTEDPSERATISWSTVKPAGKHFIRYRVKDSSDKQATLAAEMGKYIGGNNELCFYHAKMKKLQPQTAYEFQIFSDDHKSKLFYFTTAPDDDRPLSIFSGGDSRTDRKERRRVNKMLAKMVEDSYANKDPADDLVALAHGGDYIISGTNLEQWNDWMSANELTIGPDGRMLPIIPARGNHDGGKIYNDLFGLDAKDQNYFGINLGSKTRLVTLNTEISTAGDQKKWLENELKTSRPRNRWLVVQYHRPAYPAVKAPSSALQSWVPAFERYNVDLVCENDGHTIKRTVPIRGNVKDSTGVVYIGEGSLGVAPRRPKSDRWYLQKPGFASSGSHIFVLTFESNRLTSRCVELSGKVADEFSLRPREVIKKEKEKAAAEKAAAEKAAREKAAREKAAKAKAAASKADKPVREPAVSGAGG